MPERTYEGINAVSFKIDDRYKRLNYPSHVMYVSLRDNLCNSSGCLVKVGPTVSRDLIVWDDEHLTESGARYVSENILAKAIQ